VKVEEAKEKGGVFAKIKKKSEILKL